MPTRHCAAPELASLLDGSSAGELIPELSRYGLQQLIELELAAFLGADWHERTEERIGHCNDYRPRTLASRTLRHFQPHPTPCRAAPCAAPSRSTLPASSRYLPRPHQFDARRCTPFRSE